MLLSYGPLVIRTAQAADAAQLASWWNDGAVMAHAGFPLGLGTSQEKVLDQILNDTACHRLVITHDGLLIGEMNYRDLGNQEAEIGIKICEASYQEQGLGKIALSLLIRSLFVMGFAVIRLDTNLKNLRAQHVYERLGFRKTGVRLDSWRDQLGRPQSAVDYELTAEAFHDFAT